MKLALSPVASRRSLLRWCVASGAVTIAPAWLGCASTSACPAIAPGLGSDDIRLLRANGHALPLIQRTPGSRGVLRHAARTVTAADDLGLLESRMRASLATTQGVGLAAPQLGIGVRAILVRLGTPSSAPSKNESPRVAFYVNPRIVERSDESALDYEGCLSIPDLCGMVRRSRAVLVEHGLPDAPRARSESAGFEARILQHEVDHLDGVLFVDRVEGGLQPKHRLRELRQQLRAAHPELAYGRRDTSLSECLL